jgi:aldehyde:ferredoxin oxidoreductase
MARSSWINDDSTPDLDEHVGQLEHFASSLADGVVDAAELSTQESNLVAAMKAVEGSLSDDQHAKVTKLLAELTAYSVMRTLHEMAQARVQQAVAPKA